MTFKLSVEDILIDKQESHKGFEWKNFTVELSVKKHKFAVINLETKSDGKLFFKNFNINFYNKKY